MPEDDSPLPPNSYASVEQLKAATAASATAGAAVRALPPGFLDTARAAATVMQRHGVEFREAASIAVKAAAAFDAERRAAIEHLIEGSRAALPDLSRIAGLVASTRIASEGIAAVRIEWSRAAAAAFAPLQEMFARLAAQSAKARLVESRGWLPHETMPFDRLDEAAGESIDVDAIVEAHYVDNWDEVYAALSASVGGYEIDDEAKATFAEALTAHRLGLHRVAPRLLFPEIERVVSVELHEGRHHVTTPGGRKGRSIASLNDLRESVDEIPAGDVLAYNFATELLKKLDAHFYERVEDSAEGVARFAADPVPNRHASLHGIVSYNSLKSSLNALIMTDFIFHLVSRMKRYIDTAAEPDSAASP